MSVENKLDIKHVIEKYVKPIGLFQCLLLVLSGINNVPADFLSIFLLQVPKFRCKSDDEIEQNTNFTFDNLARLIGPWENGGLANLSDPSKYGCFAFSVFADPTSSLTTCTKGYVYDSQDPLKYSGSLVRHMNLVCDRSWLVPACNGIYMLGIMFGFVLGDILSSTYGRKQTIIMSSLGQLVFANLLSCLPNYYVFTTLRFFLAISISSQIVSFSYLINEFSLSKKSAILYAFNTLIANGLMRLFVCILAANIQCWQILNIVSMISCFTCIAYPFLIQESPEWLAGQGNQEEAVISLYKAYKINSLFFSRSSNKDIENISKSTSFFQEVIDMEQENSKVPMKEKIKRFFTGRTSNNRNLNNFSNYTGVSQKPSLSSELVEHFGDFGLTKLAVFGMILLSCHFLCQYGIMFYLRHINSSIFLTSSLSSISVIPAVILFLCLYNLRDSKRSSLITMYSLSSFFLILVGLQGISYSVNSDIYMTVCVNISYLLLNCATLMLYVYIADFFPSHLRLRCMHYLICLGYFGAILSDFVNELDLKIIHGLPPLVYGVILVVENVLLFLMTEKGRGKYAARSFFESERKRTTNKPEKKVPKKLPKIKTPTFGDDTLTDTIPIPTTGQK